MRLSLLFAVPLFVACVGRSTDDAESADDEGLPADASDSTDKVTLVGTLPPPPARPWPAGAFSPRRPR